MENLSVNIKSVKHIKILNWLKKFIKESNFTGQISIDFIENNLNTLPGVNIETKSTKSGDRLFSIEIDGVKLTEQQLNQINDSLTPVKQDTSLTKQEFEAEFDKRQEDADAAWELLMDYLSYIKENGTKLDFAMAMMSLKSSMKSILKTSAPAAYYFVGPDMKPSELRYEHVIPTD